MNSVQENGVTIKLVKELSLTHEEYAMMRDIHESQNIGWSPMELCDISMVDVQYYLEEMVDMEMADTIEEDAYYNLVYKGKMTASESLYVKKQILKMHSQAF